METTEIKLRGLQAKDIFTMTKIIRKIGINKIKDLLKPEETKKLMEAFNSENKSKKDESEMISYIGLNAVGKVGFIILENLENIETDVYKFISNLSGLSVKEVEKLPMVTFSKLIIDIFRKEEFKDFSKVVLELFNSEN